MGENGNGPDLFHAAPSELARLYSPLYLKSVAMTWVNPLWKAEMTHPLKKKPKPVGVCDMRDIRIENPPEKKLGAWLRSAIMPTVKRAAVSTQFGSGLNKGSTELTHMAHTAVVSAADAAGFTSAAFCRRG